MSKQRFVDPNVVRAPGKITFTDIPVNTYQKKVKDELGNFTTEQFKNIYRDMLVLREFETMIQEIKTTSEYCGVSYTHPGPAHLGIGQDVYKRQAYARGSVTYSSSNAKIATVDASGKVTGKRQGVAYITLKAASGASCQVKVTVLRAPSSVRLSMARTTLGVGETQATSYTLSRGSLGSVRYTSSNSGIAQVDA